MSEKRVSKKRPAIIPSKKTNKVLSKKTNKVLSRKTASKKTARKTASKKTARKASSSKKVALSKTLSKKVALSNTLSKKVALSNTLSKKATLSNTLSKKAALSNTLSKKASLSNQTPTGEKVSLLRMVRQAEMEYGTFSSVGRDRFFKHVNLRYPDICTVLNVDAQPGARGQKPIIVLPINLRGIVEFGTSRRFLSVVTTSIKQAIQTNKRYVWIPIQLAPTDNGLDTHSNAIHIDLQERVITLFEPHGSDSSRPEHGPFQHYYNSRQYYTVFKEQIQNEMPEYTVFVPSDYQPAVFGQSKTDIKRLLGHTSIHGDPWCVLWTCLFFKYTMTMTPQLFILKITQMSCLELTTWITTKLLYWKLWSA